MKHHLKALFLLLAVLMPATASAHDFEADGIYYNINGNEATVTYQGTYANQYSNEYSGDVAIPPTVTRNGITYPVTEIGEGAFSSCSGLTSVTIPNSVTEIGEGAFQGCSGLTSINIPNSVTEIGEDAFSECSGLTSVTIPNSVTEIGYSAFRGCSGLINMAVDPANTVYDSRNDCNAIIETASNKLITGCKNTVIPNSVTEIGEDAFSECSGLTSVTIPNSVTEIGYSAFRGCSGLTSVIIPNSVTEIGWGTFEGCSGLTSINIPNSVTEIGNDAFSGCSGLTSVTIPNSVTEIGEGAFRGCTRLTRVNITDIAAWCKIDFNIGWEDFDIYFSFSNPLYYAHHLYLNGSEVKELIIPDGVTKISDGAFWGCTGLTSVTIPNSVTSIVATAFEDCSNIVDVQFNAESCDIFGYHLFESPNISSITFGDSVTIIPGYFVQGPNKVTNLTIPNSVKEIGEGAFQGCSGLTSVTIPNSVTTIRDGAFRGCSGLTSVTIPNSVKYIDYYVFSGCTGLTSVIIPNSVTTICDGVFQGCSGLTSVTIPNSVTEIGGDAFSGCSGLTSVIIPNSVTGIGMRAFYECSGLKSVYCHILDPSFVTIDDSSFSLNSGDYSGRRLYVPLGSLDKYLSSNGWNPYFDSIVEMDSISPNCFEVDGINYRTTSETTVKVVSITNNYNDVLDIIIPREVHSNGICYQVTAIGDSAFYGNQELHKIMLPESITSIGIAAFKNCQNLRYLTCLSETPPSTNESFDEHAQRIPFEGLGIDEWWDESQNVVNGDFWLVLFINNSNAYSNYKAEFQNTKYFSYITTHEKTANPRCYEEIVYADCVPDHFDDWLVYGFDYIGSDDDDIGNCYYTDFSYTDLEPSKLIDRIDKHFYTTEPSTIFIGEYYVGYHEDSVYSIAGASQCRCETLKYSAFAIAEGKLPSDINYYRDRISPMYAQPHEESGIFYGKISDVNVQVTFGGLYTLCSEEKVEYRYPYYNLGEYNLLGRYYYSGDIVIPRSVHGYPITSIGHHAFKDCTSLTSVTLPATIQYIDDYDYSDSICFSNCPNLTRITCFATKPPTACNNSFDNGIYQNTTLYVPYSAIEAYRNADGWKNFQNIVGFYNVDFEVDGVYYSITSDHEVVVARNEEDYQGVVMVPSTVTYEGVTYQVAGIDYGAFSNAELIHLVLPATITTIGNTAFDNCHIGSLVITGNGSWTAGAIAADVEQLFVMSGVGGIQGMQMNPSTIYSYSNVPSTCNAQSFTGYDGELHVPASSLAAYFTAPYWNYFINIKGDAVEPLAVTLSKDSVDLLVGNRLLLSATPAPTNASPSDILWISSDEQVATIINGEITAIGAGECDIKVILLDKVATCHVTVTEIPPTELSLNQTFAKLEVGSLLTLTATIMPEDATDKIVSWHTTNSDVATVDGEGNVTAVGPGECTIIATCRELQATCHVVVVEHFIYISLDRHQAKLLPNHILLLTPSASPVSTDLVVTSSDPTVAAARMANGKIQVVGIAEGETTITVNSADGYAEPDSCVVTVYTEKGDLNMDGFVNMDDLSAMINYLLTDDGTGISLVNAGGCDGIDGVGMDDLSAMINFLLTGQWPAEPVVPENPDVIETYTVNGVSFKMVAVDGGTFTMGATAEQGTEAGDSEKPAHEVTLSAFSIGQTEVTQALWQAVMGSNPSHFSDDPNRPVECVSWNDCQTFITRLNQMTGQLFRLPTEAEWEFAARGGNKSHSYKFAGSDNVDDVAWYMGNIPSQASGTAGYGTQPVGGKAPNELSLYDMSGNVWEWCQDRYGSYTSEAQTDPYGPITGSTRVVRGGSWFNNYSTNCRNTRRNGCQTTDADTYLGLRLALDKTETYTVNSVSFTMVPVRGGSFTMGATEEDDADYQVFIGSPQHQVTLSGYSIGQTEVTQALWQAVMGSNPSNNTGDMQCPVENVNWIECDTFITRLNALTGKHFRLPSEAEWEFAARGGNLSRGYIYSGSNSINDVAWYSDNSGNVSHAVATKLPNELGVYDMCGNVNEWVNDWYSLYTEDPVTNPTGLESGKSHIHRGGRHNASIKYCRITRRDGFSPETRRSYLGFRLAQ